MRLSVDHRTRYRFAFPRSRLVQLLRLTPDDDDDQTVTHWDVHVDHDARLRTGRDGFGNRTVMLYVEGPVETIELTVTGEVLTSLTDGVVHGAVEPLPPALYLRGTDLTPAIPPLAAFAADVCGGTPDAVERLHRLNGALHRHCAWQTEGGPRGASRAFEQQAGAAADLAHIFMVAARSLGLPARYVSGYRAASGDLATPHAWAESFVAGLGWVTFDPTTGLSADKAYIRVAAALDAAGAAPLAGPGWGEPVASTADPMQGAAQD